METYHLLISEAQREMLLRLCRGDEVTAAEIEELELWDGMLKALPIAELITPGCIHKFCP